LLFYFSVPKLHEVNGNEFIIYIELQFPSATMSNDVKTLNAKKNF